MTDQASNTRVSSSTEVRARIEQSLQARNAPGGSTAAKLEQLVKLKAARVWDQLKKRPSLGVLLVGGTGIAVAVAIGVGELTIGFVAGYAAYQVLREGVAPKVAARDAVEEIEKL